MKAGALYLALFVCFLLLILIGTLLVSGTYQQQYFGAIQKKTDLRQNLESSLSYFLSNGDFEEGKKLNLFGGSDDTVMISTQRWGAFKVLKIQAFSGKYIQGKNFLVGAAQHISKNFALVKQGSVNRLVLCGSTVLKGSVNVQLNYISETKFEGKSASILKEIDYRKSIEIKLSSEFAECTQRQNVPSPDVLVNHFVDFEDEKFIGNSFSNQSLVIFDERDIDLAGKTIEGNIIIQSNSQIILSNTTNLDGVLLYAPVIRVKDNFIGSCQLFGEKQIYIGKNCKLNYPSIACIVNVNNVDDVLMEVNEGSCVEGALIVSGKKMSSSQHNHEQIRNKGKVTGIIHCDGKIRHSGVLEGTLIYSDFFYSNATGTYVNYLFDAIIDDEILNDNYSEPLIYENQLKYEIVDRLF